MFTRKYLKIRQKIHRFAFQQATRSLILFEGRVVKSALKYRLIVIDILDSDPDTGAAAQTGSAIIRGGHHQPGLGVCLAVHLAPG